MKQEIIIHEITDLERQNLNAIKESLFSTVSAQLLVEEVKPGDTVHLKIGKMGITIQIDNYVYEQMRIASSMFDPKIIP